MAMTESSLSTKLQTNLKSLFGNPDGDAQFFVDFCDMMAKSIVDEIQEEATIVLQAADINVNAGSFVDSVSLPVTGVGVSAAGTIAKGRIQ